MTRPRVRTSIGKIFSIKVEHAFQSQRESIEGECLRIVNKCPIVYSIIIMEWHPTYVFATISFSSGWRDKQINFEMFDESAEKRKEFLFTTILLLWRNFGRISRKKTVTDLTSIEDRLSLDSEFEQKNLPLVRRKAKRPIGSNFCCVFRFQGNSTNQQRNNVSPRTRSRSTRSSSSGAVRQTISSCETVSIAESTRIRTRTINFPFGSHRTSERSR